MERSPAATGNLAYWLSPWAAREPERVALIDLAEGERVLTYGALDERIDRVAGLLRDAGIGPGDRVLVAIGNRTAFLEAFFGAMRAGAVPVPLNTRLGSLQLAHCVADAEPAGAVLEPAAAPASAELLESRPLRLRLALGESLAGFAPFEPAVASARPLSAPVPLPEGAICFLAYTSGSTGRPKGVPLTHAGQIWWLDCLLRHWPAPEDARSLVAMPLYHKNAMAGAVKPRLASGGSIVLLPGFAAPSYLEALARYRCTHLTGVPTLFARILEERELLDRLDLSCVRAVAVGSAPVPDALFEAISRQFPNAFVHQSYGLTEGGPVMLGPPIDGRPIPVGSCGVPWPEGEVRLVGADGRPGDLGELWVKNPGVTPGYRNLPEIDRERIVEGWLRTGDLFRRDASGFYYFMGRTDDMFVCGGENVYPIEVESLLLRHPAVSEACVVPVPYRDKGEAPAAMVALKKGARADEAELKRHCLAHGPAYAHPRRVVIVDALPLTGARKIDRQAIAARLRALCADLAATPGVDRGRSMRSVGELDHVVILVDDLDAAERRFASLGFRPTPRGHHSAHMGTANTTVVLPDRRTYFELLTVRVPTPANAAQRARLARRPGLHGLAFKTTDARSAAAELAALGLGDGAAVDFARAVELADGPRDACFTVARLGEQAIPGAWCFLCQHHTPDLVWRADHLDQPNDARALVEILGWAPDLDALEGPWRLVFGERVRRSADRLEVHTGTASVTFYGPAELARRLGGAVDRLDPDEPGLAAMAFAVEDTARTRALLERNGIAVLEGEGGAVLVPAAAAFGVAIVFRPAAAG
ncbi:MAG: AMP-binding protein [Geminicoccaceae bacterium]|nr:AMP-binding protein [Geminicoccaceae bacterium]